MSIATPAGLIISLSTGGYMLMFLLMTIEGAIVTYVAAFAASLGIFNIYIVLVLSILGNILGDLALYAIGRYGGKAAIHRYILKKQGAEKIKRIKAHLEENPGKTIAVVKLTPALPIPGIILIGTTDIPFWILVFYSSIISISYSIVFTLLGYYSGAAFNSIAKYVGYSGFLIGGVVVLAVGIWLAVRYISKGISKKIEHI